MTQTRSAEYSWSLPVGATTTRQSISEAYGGSRFGGIEPSGKTPNVFIYSDPQVGHAYGYNFDGWTSDGSAFLYTGEGPNGDQQLEAGNRAILSHADDSRALRVFVADGKRPGSQTKIQRYIGEFTVDPIRPADRAEAPGQDGVLRTVLVFRLIPVGEVFRRAKDASLVAHPGGHGTAELIPVRAALTPEGSAEAVPLEAITKRSYLTGSSTSATAVKREAELIERFGTVLNKRGHRHGRYRLYPRDSLYSLLTDLYDHDANVLYEGKGVATREAIRMAIGQLLDYRRHITPSPTLAVLLPACPAQDLLDLLDSLSIECVYETPTGFEAAGGLATVGL